MIDLSPEERAVLREIVLENLGINHNRFKLPPVTGWESSGMTRKQYREMCERNRRAAAGLAPNPPRPEPELGLAGIIARDRRDAAERASQSQNETTAKGDSPDGTSPPE